MIDHEVAATEIRSLSRLKGYPRSWEQAEGAAAEQDTQAELALIEAAANAPSLTRLRQFVNDWQRRHVEAPVPAVLYEAWRANSGYRGTSRMERCGACGDSGWVTRYFVSDAIADPRAARIYIGEAEVADWWNRIRANKTCAQRVYEESIRCGCGSMAPEVRKDVESDSGAYRDFAQRAAGDE